MMIKGSVYQEGNSNTHTHSNPKCVCTEEESLKTCEAKTEWAERNTQT